MTAIDVAVVASAVYFAVFGAGFVFRPAFAERLGLTWTEPAGKTEVRCYYGAISWALAAFLLYLLDRGQGVTAETLVLFLASGVVTMRVIGTVVDGGWSSAYTRTAIPVEVGFVIALAVIRTLA